MLMRRAPAARRSSYSGRGVQASGYLPIEATADSPVHPSSVAIMHSPRGNDGAFGHLGHLILSMKFFYLLRLKKTPISWYTSYAVGELAFPLKGEVIA